MPVRNRITPCLRLERTFSTVPRAALVSSRRIIVGVGTIDTAHTVVLRHTGSSFFCTPRMRSLSRCGVNFACPCSRRHLPHLPQQSWLGMCDTSSPSSSILPKLGHDPVTTTASASSFVGYQIGQPTGVASGSQWQRRRPKGRIDIIHLQG